MALHVRQTDNQSDLQRRIAADLQEKSKKRPLTDTPDHDQPDGVDDSRYIEGTKQTTSLAWVWVLIGIATVAIILWLTISSTAGR